MAWTISLPELAEGVHLRREFVAERPTWGRIELLARGLRWIDELAESQELFRRAAVDVIERIDVPGRGDGTSRARTAGFFALAGAHDEAREWAQRATTSWLQSGRPDERDLVDAVDTLYAAGEAEPALALARAHAVRSAGVELLEAECDGDLARCDAFAAATARELNGERALPFDSSGMAPLNTWDWLELAYLVRARIAGDPAPAHAEVLRRTGWLVEPPVVRRVVRVQAGGVDRVPITGADDAPIQAIVDRQDADYVELRLDPRPEHYLAIGVDWSPARGHHARLYTEPLTSPAFDFPHDDRDFTETVDAAAAWLESVNLGDRDGSWAARTLRELAARLPLSEG